MASVRPAFSQAGIHKKNEVFLWPSTISPQNPGGRENWATGAWWPGLGLTVQRNADGGSAAATHGRLDPFAVRGVRSGGVQQATVSGQGSRAVCQNGRVA